MVGLRRLQLHPPQTCLHNPCLCHPLFVASTEPSWTHPSNTRGQPQSTRRSTYSEIRTRWSLRKMLFCWPKFGVVIAASSKRTNIIPTVDPVWPRCGEKPHTVEHWLTECPGTEATRQEIFGGVSVPLSILMEEPGKAVLMSRRTL